MYRKSFKLNPRYYSPYQVIERIGAVAYKIKLPEGSAVQCSASCVPCIAIKKEGGRGGHSFSSPVDRR